MSEPGTGLFPIAFTLLAAAAAFVLDEPASLVVDVTPTGPVRRTAIRSLALLAPLAAGAVLMLAGALRGLAQPWAATGLALVGNVALGFAVSCVARTRTGEPGAPASATVVLTLMAPSLLPPVARRVSTFPTSGGGLSSNTVWWTVLAVCVAARRREWHRQRIGVRRFRDSCDRERRPRARHHLHLRESHVRQRPLRTDRGANDRAAARGLPRGLRRPGRRRWSAAVAASVRDRGLGRGILLGATFWWGFDLPFAWLNAAVVLTFLVLAWTAQNSLPPGNPSSE